MPTEQGHASTCSDSAAAIELVFLYHVNFIGLGTRKRIIELLILSHLSVYLIFIPCSWRGGRRWLELRKRSNLILEGVVLCYVMKATASAHRAHAPNSPPSPWPPHLTSVTYSPSLNPRPVLLSQKRHPLMSHANLKEYRGNSIR